MGVAGTPPARISIACLVVVSALALTAGRGADDPDIRFAPDDPIWTDNDTVADAGKVLPQDLSQQYDFLENSFASRGDRRDVRAVNVNTLDEVPDSTWFANRIGHHPLDDLALVRGPNRLEALDNDAWTIVAGKNTGLQPGVRAVMTGASDRQLYQLELDPPRYPDLATGAEMVGTLLYHALGYHVVENYIVWIDPAKITIDPKAAFKDRAGKDRPFTQGTLTRLLWRAAKAPDGRYRALASRFAPGKPVGQFRYHGRRPDDPNDIHPHEHRRELRAARVFAAWVNHDDSRANNTLDMLEGQPGAQYIRHYMFDFGSIMGSGTTGPDSPRSGRTYLIDGQAAWKVLRTLGAWAPDWARRRIPPFSPSAGPFMALDFDPVAWKAEYPNAAFLNMRADDAFWGARRVAAFSDAQLLRIVEQARYTDPAATEQIVEALIGRRDIIAKAWLTAVTPIVSPSLEGGRLRFENAAVTANAATAPTQYTVEWLRFDNETGDHELVGEALSVPTPEAPLPAGVPSASGYVCARIRATHPDYPHWSSPVSLYFRRDGDRWTPVGLVR